MTGLLNTVDDGLGSGVAFTEISIDDTTWTQTNGDSYSLTLSDGVHTISLRATDNVGNVGPISQVTIQVDTEAPIEGQWNVDEITTALIGAASVEFLASDFTSGVDITGSYIEYGFDSNGLVKPLIFQELGNHLWGLALIARLHNQVGRQNLDSI